MRTEDSRIQGQNVELSKITETKKNAQQGTL